MTEHANGPATHGPTINSHDTTAGKPQAVPPRMIIDQAKGVMVVLARGMFSLLAHLNYEGVLVCMAQACGEMLAEACWCSDVMVTIQLRQKVKDAMNHGMKVIPSISPVSPDQMPQANGSELKQ